jgi:ribonuclease HI
MIDNASVSTDSIVVFTDGAAKGNPGPGGWGAIIATPEGRVKELGGRSPMTTNNKMELTGAIAALEHLQGVPGPLQIYTDSTYVIQGITQWIFGWRRKGWRTAEGGEVLNREYWEQLSALVAARGSSPIKWHYVRGHVGIPGNERVDEIADTLARQENVTLYDGPLTGYGHAIFDLPDDTSVPARSDRSGNSSKNKAPAHSYLSLVDGELMRHTTWADCERRVKGRSGARFKKATSAADEAEILRGWGVNR